jgi:hypothetical protein
MTVLQQTVEKAYQLFAAYHAKTPLDICTAGCCMDPAEAALLASLPVREIPVDLLRLYTNGAKSDSTPPTEVKHFLPRYLELIAQFDIPSHSVEIVLRQLSCLSPTDWKPDEQQLLTDFAHIFGAHCLSIYPLPEGETIDNFLIMFHLGGFDLDPLLRLWERTYGETALWHYRDLALLGFKHHKAMPTLQNDFSIHPLAQILHAWAFSTSVKAHFSAAIETAILENNLSEADTDSLNLLYELLVPPNNK